MIILKTKDLFLSLDLCSERKLYESLFSIDMIILLWYKCKDVNVYRKLEIAMRGNYERFIKVEDINIAERDHLGSVGIDISHFSNCHILPGLTDVHVHLREPFFI